MDRNIVPFPTRINDAPEAWADFDESQFPVSDDVLEEYTQDVRAGYRAMKKRRIVITGLARDVGDVLPLTMARMERQGQMFADYRVVIYENDSSAGIRHGRPEFQPARWSLHSPAG